MSFKSIVTFQIKTKNCHNVVTRSRLESKACYWHSRYWTIFLVLCMFPDAPVPKLLDHSGRCYTPITSRMIKNLGEDKLKAWLKSPTWCKGEGGAQLNLTNKLKKKRWYLTNQYSRLKCQFFCRRSRPRDSSALPVAALTQGNEMVFTLGPKPASLNLCGWARTLTHTYMHTYRYYDAWWSE